MAVFWVVAPLSDVSEMLAASVIVVLMVEATGTSETTTHKITDINIAMETSNSTLFQRSILVLFILRCGLPIYMWLRFKNRMRRPQILIFLRIRSSLAWWRDVPRDVMPIVFQRPPTLLWWWWGGG